MKVEFYDIFNGEQRCLWEGELSLIPRVGEVAYLDSVSHIIENVEHFVGKDRVEILVR